MMIHNCMALTEYYISRCCRSSLKAIAWEDLSAVIEMSHRWVEKWEIYAASNNLLCASTARAIYAINYSPLFRWAHENYWKHRHCVQDCSFASTTGTLGAYREQQVDVSASPFSERRKPRSAKIANRFSSASASSAPFNSLNMSTAGWKPNSVSGCWEISRQLREVLCAGRRRREVEKNV